MNDNSIETTLTTRTRPNCLHYINLVWNGLLFLSLSFLSVGSLIGALRQDFNSGFGMVSERVYYLLAYFLGFLAIIALIAFIGSVRKVGNKSKASRDNKAKGLYFVIFAFPLLLYALVSWDNPDLLPDWLFSILVFLAILVPLVWIVRLASGRLWGRHVARCASIITWTVGVSTPFMMLVQSLLVLLLILVLVATGGNEIFRIFAMGDFEALLSLPTVLISTFLLLSVFAPVIEELFKTLALWPLLGLRITPEEGYKAGLLSGAAFAFIEGSLFATQAAMGPGTDWVFFILGRFGGSLLHIFNGGIIGWALAKTWLDKKFYRAVLAYLIAMVIHGLWNGIVFLAQLLPTMLGKEYDMTLLSILMLALGILVAGGFAIFVRHISRGLKQQRLEHYVT